MDWKIYMKFTFIIFAFMMANTLAFTLGIQIYNNSQPLFSVPATLAIGGVILANCAAVQLLLAGKYSLEPLFYIGLIPIIGFLISYLLMSQSSHYNLAMILYCLSLTLGILLLFFTVKNLQNKKSLVL